MDSQFDEHLGQAHRAVQRWAAFPVHATPRPLVLPGAEVLTRGGFRTGEAKDAFSQGQFLWSVEVPKSVRAQLRPDAAAGPRNPDLAPLEITHAGFAKHEFSTDRGLMTLPAWWLRGPAINGPVWVLDPTIERWQPPDGAASPVGSGHGQPLFGPIELSADGQSIVIAWLGSIPQVETYPRAEVVETDTAVSAVALRVASGISGGVPAVGVTHRVPARLDRPLGSRVFVNLHGHAVAVTKVC